MEAGGEFNSGKAVVFHQGRPTELLVAIGTPFDERDFISEMDYEVVPPEGASVRLNKPA